MNTHRSSRLTLIVVATLFTAASLQGQQQDWRTAVAEERTSTSRAAPAWALKPTLGRPWSSAAAAAQADELGRVRLISAYEEIGPPQPRPLPALELPPTHAVYDDPCAGRCRPCSYCGNGMPFCEYCDASCFPIHNSPWIPDWATLDAVFWWPQGPESPPMVTSDPPTESPATAGVLPDAQIRFGGDMLAGLGTGGLLSFGYWTDPSLELGIGSRFYVMHSGGNKFDLAVDPVILNASERAVANDQRTILALPFIDAQTGDESAIVLARGPVDDGIVSVMPGGANVRTPIDFTGGDLHVRRALLQTCRGQRLYFVGGYEYARLDEQLTVTAFFTTPGTPLRQDIFDEFSARNEFHGGHLGLMYEHDVGRWNFSVQGKVALGNVHQTLRTRGMLVQSDTSIPSTLMESPSGFYTQPTNIGTFEQNEFGAIPQLQVQFQKRLACVYGRRLQLDLGYDLFFFNSLLRPGAQVDRRINLSQLGGGTLVGPPLPDIDLRTSSMWLQGFRLGVTWTH